MYLFDTDVITNVLKPSPSDSLVKKLQDIPKKSQYISSISVYEIVYGAYKSRRAEYHLQKFHTLLLPSIQLAGFDASAAYVCGALRAELESSGVPLSLADLQIASIALARDLTLITGNVKHFNRIMKLRVENWL